MYRLEIGVPEISLEISGGNSSVFKGRLPSGTELAIKKYRGDQLRIERMLSREQRAITFLRENGLTNIPEILEVRGDLGLIVSMQSEAPMPQTPPMPMPNRARTIKKVVRSVTKAVETLNSE